VVSRVSVILLVLLVGVYEAGCASGAAVPRPFPRPSPRGRTAPAPESTVPNPELRIDGYVVAGAALQHRGAPYRLGGADPATGFDCSGLVQYVYAQYGLTVPRDVRSQYRAGRKIDDEDIEPGDLLFFATEGHDASHVAIAISSRQFVHAPNSTGVVRVEMRTSDYWGARYLGARRVIE